MSVPTLTFPGPAPAVPAQLNGHAPETATAAPAEQEPARTVDKARARLVTAALAIPAAMALGLSASTSYRFAADKLYITNLNERFWLCATVETAIIALTLHAWGARSKASAWLAYGLVAVQSIPAFEVSGGAGGLFRIAAGPVLLAVLLHKLLGLEGRFSGAVSTGLLAAAGREIRERLTASLGIGRRGADSAAIARSRAADRAVALASARRLNPRSAARLAVAIDAARHGLDEVDADAAEAASIVARVVRRRSVAELHSLDARHVWMATDTAKTPATNAPGGGQNPANPPAKDRPKRGQSTADRVAKLTAKDPTLTAAEVAAKLSIGERTARRYMNGK
jgi:hypothetical protein